MFKDDKMKEDILQKLIDMMEEKESEGLKKLSPKFMKDTEVVEDVMKDELPEVEEESEDDDMKRLLEMYKNL